MKIAQGYSRTAFIFKNFVIKIPRIKLYYRQYGYQGFFYGFKCNKHEALNYSFYRLHCIADRLAKVYYCAPFGIFLIMERVQTFDNFKQKHISNYYEKTLKKELVLFNGNNDCVLGMDMHPKNFGFRGRKLVLLDYA